MDEPPILPKDWADESAVPADGNSTSAPSEVASAESNPFAPVAVGQAASNHGGGIQLSPMFWLLALFGLAGFGLLAVAIPWLGVPSLIAMIAAVIRVPLLMREKRIRPGRVKLPDAPVLLSTSWVFMAASGMASVIAFFFVCAPTGYAAFAIGMDDGQYVFPAVLGISGLAAICVFLFLFYLSLRLPT